MRMRSGARWPWRRIDPWISIVDPDGLVHCIGDIQPSHDYTECGREIVSGWYATKRHRLRTRFCARCRLVARRHRLGPVGVTTSAAPSNVVFRDNTFRGDAS